MLKMERGAARAAGRNARVFEMEDLKRARECRASSARHLTGQAGEMRGGRPEQSGRGERSPSDDRPFWEKENPFEEQDKPFWQMDRPFRGMENDREDRKPAKPRQPARAGRTESRSTRQAERSRREESREPAQTASGFARANARPQTKPAERPAERKGNRKNGQSGLHALFVMMGLLALLAFIGMKTFEIRNIDVSGADTVTPESIIALSGVATGENIFMVSLSQARQNLESDPLVEVLGISRVFPDKIKIDIRQRQPHGAIAWLGGYVIIDEKGFALDVRDTLPVGQFPLLTGVDIAPAERGRPIEGVDSGKMAIMQNILTALYDERAIRYVSEINLSDAGKIMMLTAEGLSIDIGKPTDLTTKAKWIAGSVPELRKKGLTSGVLYVSGPAGPVFTASNTTGASQDGGETVATGSADGNVAPSENSGEGESAA